MPSKFFFVQSKSTHLIASYILISVCVSLTLEKELVCKDKTPGDFQESDVTCPVLRLIPDARKRHVKSQLKEE